MIKLGRRGKMKKFECSDKCRIYNIYKLNQDDSSILNDGF